MPNKIDNEHLSVLDVKSPMTLGRGGLTEKVQTKGLKGNKVTVPGYRTSHRCPGGTRGAGHSSRGQVPTMQTAGHMPFFVFPILDCSFLLLSSFALKGVPQFVHLSLIEVEGCLGCYQFLAVTNKAAISIHVQAFV